MNKAVLIIGGNIGDRGKNINLACKKIAENIGKIHKTSAIYETEPWGFVDERPFLNQVLIIETRQTAIEILKQINKIEDDLGRKRCSSQYISRTMDIDILFYNDKIINSEHLVIPHPRIAERMFVLKPLYEIVPTMEHPIYKKKIIDLYENCDDTSSVKPYKRLT